MVSGLPLVELRAPAGKDGADGHSIVIEGVDTSRNIINKPVVDGDIWISTDTGFDSDSNNVVAGDGLLGKQGKWILIGPMRGPRGVKGDISTVPGPQGPHGSAGIAGAEGPSGKQGTGIKIKGTVATKNDLPTATNTDGDAYICIDDKDVYMWSTALSHWIDLGHVRGPEGPRGIQGRSGIQGPQGVSGRDGSQGHRGDAGIRGAQGIRGNQGVIGRTGKQGIQGQKSNVPGPQGQDGHDGLNGNDGARGLKGDKGDIGIRGQRGVDGTIGHDGKDGVGVRIRGFDTKSNILQKNDPAGDMWLIDNPGKPDHGHGMLSNGSMSWKEVGPYSRTKGFSWTKG